jgi:hypothetical protein
MAASWGCAPILRLRAGRANGPTLAGPALTPGGRGRMTRHGPSPSRRPRHPPRPRARGGAGGARQGGAVGPRRHGRAAPGARAAPRPGGGDPPAHPVPVGPRRALDWWGTWSRRTLLLMLPGAMAGILVGWATAALVSDAAVRLIVGGIALAFVGRWLWQRRGAVAPRPESAPRGALWGGSRATRPSWPTRAARRSRSTPCRWASAPPLTPGPTSCSLPSSTTSSSCPTRPGRVRRDQPRRLGRPCPRGGPVHLRGRGARAADAGGGVLPADLRAHGGRRAQARLDGLRAL